MCFGVRFSLYLASWLSDFDLLFFCVCGFWPPCFFPRKWGAKAPLAPLDPRLSGIRIIGRSVLIIDIAKRYETITLAFVYRSYDYLILNLNNISKKLFRCLSSVCVARPCI